MSISALKSLKKANEILSVLGLSVNTRFITDEDLRKDWRNADVLACLIIESAANALQCETDETLKENMFDSMQDAVDCYIFANLESWNQIDWPARDVKKQLARLAEMVKGQQEYNARQEAHAEALEVNAIIDRAVQIARHYTHNGYLMHIGVQRAIDHVRRELLDLERYPASVIVKLMVSVRRLAKLAQEQAQKEYLEMMARPRVTGIDSELPF